jgi:filamentous hemagglutinin family protein
MAKMGKVSRQRRLSGRGTRGRARGGLGRSVSMGVSRLRGGLVISPLIALLASPVLAGPEGEQVAAGSASFQRQGAVTTIHVADRTIINYSSFDIAGHETVRFVQPGVDSRVLNRINSAMPTQIDGTLLANGRVYIANPAGVIFGQGSVVNAAGIVAAAGSITDSDFLGGIDRFTNLQGDVINHGALYADTVHLLGRHVANFGSIDAKDVVTLIAGDQVLIGERGGRIYARMSATELAEQAQAVSSSSTMLASGDVYSVAIHDLSSIRARSVQAHADVVNMRGTIDASTKVAGQQGGRVELLGDRVAIDGGRIDVSGHSGGGVVRVGGGLRGQEAGLHNAQMTIVTANSQIKADALVSGDGGSVVLWSDQGTAFMGEISARGAHTGDGGFVEVSGKHGLYYKGDVHTQGGKAGGREGTLLLDPLDIRVVADGTGDSIDLVDVDNFLDPDSNLNGNAFPNEIEASVIEGASSDVILQAERDITFDAALSLSNTGIGLTAEAGRDIVVNQSITTLGGDVRLIANAATAPTQLDGSITVNAPIDTAAGGVAGGGIDLVLDGGSGRIFLGADLSTDGGAISLQGPVTVSGVRTIDTAGTSLTAGSIVVSGELRAADGSASLDLDARADTTGGDVTLQSVTGSDADVFASLDVRTSDSGGGSGTIMLEGDVLTGGTQTYDGFAVLGAGSSELSSVTGQIVFEDALSLGSGLKTLRAVDVDFADSVVGSFSTPPTLVLITLADGRIGGGVENPGELTLTVDELSNLIGPFEEIVVHAGNDLFVSGGSSAFSAPVRLGGGNELVLENGANLSTVGDSITLGDGLGDVRMVGGATVLIATGLTGDDIVINPAGALRTTGDVSDGSLTLSAGTGDIVLDSDVGILNNAPGVFSPETSGALRLNGSTVRAVQADFSQFSGPVIVDGSASIITDNALDLSPARSIVSFGGVSTLELNTPAALSLPEIGSDSVLGLAALDSLTLTSGGVLTLHGDVTSQSIDSLAVISGVVLASDVVLTTSSAFDLSNATGIDGDMGGESLEIVAASAILPAIGQSVRLGDVRLETTGGATLLGNVWTQAGHVTVDGPLTIGADLSIETLGGDVAFLDATNGSVTGHALTIDAGAGGVALDDVGLTVPLGSLDVMGSSIVLNGSVTTSTAGGGSGLQRYNGTTTITGTSQVFSTDGLVAFISGFDAGGTNVTIAGDEIDFGGSVGGNGLLELFGLADVESFRIGFAAPSVGSVDLNPTELAFLQPGFTQITIGRPSASVSQSITVGGGSSISFSNPVVLRAPSVGGTVVVDTNTVVDHSGLLGAFIQILGTATTMRSGSGLLTNNAQILVDSTLLLDGPGVRTLDSNGGAIEISGDIDGAGTLRLDSATGLLTLVGNVGSSTPLVELELISSGDAELGLSGGVGDLVYSMGTLDVDALSGPVTLRQSWDVTVSGGSAVDLSNVDGLDGDADGAQSVRFTLGTSDLSLPAVGSVHRLGGISIVSADVVTLTESLLVSGGDIDLSGAGSVVVVSDPTLLTLSALNGNIQTPTLSGTRALRYEATGDGVSSGLVSFGGVLAGQSQVPVSLEIDAEVLTLLGSVFTSGLIDFSGTPVVLVANSVAIDSDPSDAIPGVTAGGNAGDILFDHSGTVTASGPGLSLIVDARADGGGDSGSVVLPGGFFQGFDSTMLAAGLIELDTSIIVEGDVELIGRVEQSASVTIDTNADDLGASGVIDLDQAIFHATMPGLVLTLDTTSTDAAAGDVYLLAADDFFGSASYLGGVVVQTQGVGGSPSVFLATSIELDASGAGQGLAIFGGADLRLTGPALIRTDALSGGNAGEIDLSGSTFVVDAGATTPTLLLDASSVAGIGADIVFGAIDTTSRRFDSFEARTGGATGDGLLRMTAATTLLRTVGGFVVTGRMEPDGDVTIETQGGSIDLADAVVAGGVSGLQMTLRVIDSIGGAGQVFLGSMGNRGGVASFINGVEVDTVAASDGTLTLNGQIQLTGPGGFVYSGSGVAVSGSSSIDTHQSGATTSGDVTLNAPVYGLTPGATLSLSTATNTGSAPTGSVMLGDVGNNGGSGGYLSSLSVDTRGDTAGDIVTGGSIALDGDLSLLGVWRLSQNTAVVTNADGLGAGGNATLTNTSITDDALGFDLSIDTSGEVGFDGGDILLGNLDSFAGPGVSLRGLLLDTGSNGDVVFRSDDDSASTLTVETVQMFVAGDLVVDVPLVSISTVDATIDLSGLNALRAFSNGRGRIELDAGTASVLLPASVGQTGTGALGGLQVIAGTMIGVNGSITTSTAGGLSGDILLDGPVVFEQSSTLTTPGGLIEITGTTTLRNGAAVRLDTTAGGSLGQTITLRGNVLGETADTESLVLDAGSADLQLWASVGTDLVPLALLELISSGRVEFGPTSGVGASYYAQAFELNGLTGHAVLPGDALFTVGGSMAFDLSNLASSGVSFGLNGVSAGGQSLVIDAPLADVLLPAVGAQTALGGVQVLAAQAVTLGGDITVEGGDIDFDGTQSVLLDAAQPGDLELTVTDGDILFNIDGSIDGAESLVLEAIDTTTVTPRLIRMGSVGSTQRLTGFELTSDTAELWGDVLTDGGDIGIFADATARRSIVIDTDAAGGSGNAGNAAFGAGFSGFAAGAHTLLVDVTADGGGSGGTISLPTGFFQDFASVELRAGLVNFVNDILIDGDFTFVGEMVLGNSITIDTNADNLGDGGLLDLSSARISADAADYTLTIDTSTTESGFAGGIVELGEAGNGDGGVRSFVGGLVITTDSYVAGTTAGAIRLHNNILLDGSSPRFEVISGGELSIDAAGVVTVTLNGDGMAGGDGGVIDLSLPVIGTSTSGAGLRLVSGQGGSVNLGEVVRTSVGLAMLEISTPGGRTTLGHDVAIDGDLTLLGALTVVDQSLILDTNGGTADLSGTVLAAGADGIDLTIRSAGSNGTGVMVLGAVSDSASGLTAHFINDLTLEAGQRIDLIGDVRLAGLGSDTGDFEVVSADTFDVFGTRLIDTQQGGAGDAGSVLFPTDGSLIVRNNGAASLTIDASAVSGDGGSVVLADVVGLNGLTVNTQGTIDGIFDAPASISIDGPLTVRGTLRLLQDTVVRTDHDGTGNAGEIDLSGSTFVVDAGATTPTLLLDASSVAGIGADIVFGAIDTTSRRFDSFEARTGGATGDGLLRMTAATTLLRTVGGFVVTGRMEPDGDVTIETQGGSIDLADAVVAGGVSGLQMTLRVIDSIGGAGQVFLGSMGNRGGVASFINGVEVDTVAASDGTLTLNGQIQLTGPGGFVYSGSGVAVSGSSSIDTHQSGATTSGDVTLNAPVYGLTPGATLSLSTATNTGSAPTGSVMLGDVGNNGGSGGYLSSLSVDTRGDTAGDIVTGGSIALDGDLSLLGVWRLSQNTAVVTNADGLGAGGNATLTNTSITDDALGFDLSIDTSGEVGFDGGDILLGNLDSFAGPGVSLRGLLLDTGSNGDVVFRSDDDSASTLTVETVQMFVAGDLVVDVPLVSISTVDATIDLSGLNALRAFSNGRGRIELDAGTASVLLPASVGQTGTGALGGLQVIAGTMIGVNGSITTSTAGGLSGDILLDGPVVFEQSSTLTTPGGLIEITGTTTLRNGAAVRLDTTAGGSLGQTITLRGNVLGETADTESLVLDAGSADLQLWASVGTDLVPLALLELISSGRVEFGPTSGVGASYYAQAFELNGLTGHAVLPGDALFTVGGSMAFDLSNLASSGVSFGLNGVSAGGQSLVIDAPLADVLLPAVGAQTALGGVQVLAAQAVTLGGDITVEGGDIDFDGTQSVLLDAAQPGDLELTVTDGDILFNIDGSIDGAESLVLEAIDTTTVTPRLIRMGSVGSTQRLTGFELTSDTAELWGDVLTDGGDIGIFADATARRSIVIDTDAAGGSGNAGNAAFGAGFSGFAAGAHTLLVDVTADGGGSGGTISLPTGFFQDFASVELRAGLVNFVNDILIDGDFTFVGEMVLGNSITIDTNADNLGDGGLLDLSSARISADAADYTLTIDTSTTESGFAGGIVELGEAGNGDGGVRSFVGGLVITTDSYVAGTTAGAIRLHNNILLDGSSPRFEVISGGELSIDAAGVVTVTLNGDGMAGGDGGVIDLSLPVIGTSTSGAGLRLVSGQGGSVNLGEVVRTSVGLAMLEISTPGGRTTLGHDVAIDGDLTLLGALTVVDQSLILDTNGGTADLSGTVLAAGADGIDLTIRSAGSNGTGVMVLGAVSDSASGLTAHFINDLTLEAGQRIDLIGDVRLAGLGSDTGDFEVVSADTFDVFGTRLIDTQQGGAGDAGSVLFPTDGSLIVRNNGAASLTIDASAVSGDGGSVVLADVVGLNGLTVNTQGTIDGIFDAPASISIDGPLTVRGTLRLLQDTVVRTDHDGTGNAGDIDLSEAMVFSQGASNALVLDASSSVGAGGDVTVGHMGDSASGVSGDRVELLVIGTQGATGSGDLILDRADADVSIDVVRMDLGGNFFGSSAMNGDVLVARSAELITDERLDLSPSQGVFNNGSGSTTLLVRSRSTTGVGASGGVVLPAGGVGTLANPFGELVVTANGAFTISALGDLYAAASGGSSGDVTLTGLFTLADQDSILVRAQGGTASFNRSTPTGSAIDLNRGVLTVVADGLEIVGLANGRNTSTPRGSFVFRPASGGDIGLGSGVNPGTDVLISTSTLAAFGELVDRVTIGELGSTSGTSLIEVGSFTILAPLTLQTSESGLIDLSGTVINTADEFRLLGPARVRTLFTLNTTGPGGTLSGGGFVAERTLNGTTQGALLNGRRLGVDALTLTLGADGYADFNGDVGMVVPVGNITISGGDSVSFDQRVHASSLRQGALAGSADNGTGITRFSGESLFTGTLGLVLETDSVFVFDDINITGGAARFNADVALLGDILTASQTVAFERSLDVIGSHTVNTTLSQISPTGTASSGANISMVTVNGQFDDDAAGDGSARLVLIAGTAGDITIGQSSGGSFIGGVGQDMTDDLTELRIVSADEFNLQVPTRVGMLVQESGRLTTIRGAVTTFDDGQVDLTNSTRIDLLANIAADGPARFSSADITLSADVRTISDTIDFIGDTTVTKAVTVSSGVGFGGNITFDGLLDASGAGVQSLVLNSGVARNILFSDLVGSKSPLEAITIQQAQDVTASRLFRVGSLTQIDTQDLTLFSGGLVVTGTTDLNGGRYRILTSADLGGRFTITNSGLLELPKIPVTLGNSFIQDGTGPSNIAANLIAPGNFVIDFTGPVSTPSAVEFGGDRVVFRNTLDVGSSNLTLSADDINLLGGANSVRGSGDLLMQPRTSSAAIDLGSPAGGAAEFSLSTADLAALRDGFRTVTVGRANGAHDVTIGSALFRDPTTLRYASEGGSALILNALSGVGNASLTLRGPGATTTVAGEITTQGQPVLIDDAVVVSTDGASVLTSGGAFTVTGTINGVSAGVGSLLVDSGNGVTDFQGVLGGVAPLGALDVTAATFRSKALTTTGNQSIVAAFLPDGDVTSLGGSLAVNGPTTLVRDIRFAAGGSGTEILFNGPIDGEFDAVFANALGFLRFASPIGGSAPLASIDATAGSIEALSVTTTGFQSLTGASNLRGDLTSTGQGSIVVSGPTTLLEAVRITTAGNRSASSEGDVSDDIVIGRTDGPFALTLDAGNALILATGALGTLTPLSSLTAEASSMSFLSVITQGAQAYLGDTTTRGLYESLASGGIGFSGDVTLAGDTTMRTNGTALGVTGTIDGAFALAANVTSGGLVNFNGDIGSTVPLTNLAVTAGTANLQGVTTSGSQNYLADASLNGDLVAGGSVFVQRTATLNTDVLVDATGVTFEGPVNGAHALTVSAGDGNASFAAIGDSTPLSSLTVLDAARFAAGSITAGLVDLNAVDVITNSPITTLVGGLTVTNSGTWEIVPGAAFTLAGPFVQDGTGPTAISTNVSTATDMFFGAPVELRADSVTLTGPNVSLLAGVRTDGTPRALVVSASEVATLSQSIGTDSNPLQGFSSAGTGRLDLNAADMVSLTGLRFDQPVIVQGDSYLRVIGGRPGGGSELVPGAVAQLDNRQPLPALSPDSIVFTDVILAPRQGVGGSLTLLVNLEATGALLPKIFLGNDVGVATNSTSGLDLSNFGALTNFSLNADARFSPIPNLPGERNGHVSVPTVATIISPTNITIETIDTFRMGINEKFTSLGSMSINSVLPSGDVVIQRVGEAYVGDLTAGGSIFIDTPQIFILSRSSGPVLQPGGILASDFGIDFVAADQIRFNGGVAVLSSSPNPGSVTLATLSGGGTSNSLVLFSTRSISEVNIDALGLGFDLRSEGATNTNVSQAIAGAVPRASEADDVSQSTSVSAAQKEVLRQLGIFARDASDDVLRDALLVGRSLYSDYNTPDSQTRRQEVTAQRMDQQTVDNVIELAQQLLFGSGSGADQLMRESLNKAVDAWAEAEDPQEWDAVSLLNYMRANAAEHADALQTLEVLHVVQNQIESMGLAAGEIRDQRSVLLGQFRPVRLKIQQFYDLVQLSRASSDSVAASDQGEAQDAVPQG